MIDRGYFRYRGAAAVDALPDVGEQLTPCLIATDALTNSIDP